MTLIVKPGFNGMSDPDASAYVTAVEAADGQLLEYAVGSAINSFVLGCKNDGVWDAIKASCILAGARTLAGALIPLKGAAPSNPGSVFVSDNYNRKTGLVGDGSTKYLNSNRASNADSQDNVHVSVYVETATTAAAGQYPIYIGAGNGAAGSLHIGRLESNGSLFTRMRTVGNDNFSPGSATGLIGATRSSSASYSFRSNSTTSSATRASDGVLSQSTTIFATNTGSIISYSNARIAFYSIGESLDLAKLDTRVSALITAIGAAIP